MRTVRGDAVSEKSTALSKPVPHNELDLMQEVEDLLSKGDHKEGQTAAREGPERSLLVHQGKLPEHFLRMKDYSSENWKTLS